MWIQDEGENLGIAVLTHSPQKVLPPINLIIAEIEAILSDHPGAHPMNPTSLSVSWSLKRLETLPRTVPFHGTLHAIVAPKIWLHHPAKIIVFLKGTPSEIHLLGRTPNHQRHRGIVSETIDHSNVVIIGAQQEPCPLYCGHHHDNGRGKTQRKVNHRKFHGRLWRRIWYLCWASFSGFIYVLSFNTVICVPYLVYSPQSYHYMRSFPFYMVYISLFKAHPCDRIPRFFFLTFYFSFMPQISIVYNMFYESWQGYVQRVTCK